MGFVPKRYLILKVIAEVGILFNLTPVWRRAPALSSLLLWKQGRSRWSHWLASPRSRGSLLDKEPCRKWRLCIYISGEFVKTSQ